MKPRDYVFEQIRHRHTQPVPYTLGFEGDIADRLDEYYGGRSWRECLVPYVVSVAVVDTMQQTSVDEAHGRDIFGALWRTDRRPMHLVEPPLPGDRSLAGYIFPDAGRFVGPALFEMARQEMAAYPGSFGIIEIPWGIFENVWRIRGFENAMMDAVADPGFYGEMVERLTELYLGMVEGFEDIPADAVYFADDWGDQRGVILGPERWRRLIKPCWARVFDATHAQGKLVMCHACGSVADIIPDLIDIGLDVLESVQPEPRDSNLYELKRKWGDKITFWGCLGSQSTIPFGTPESIQAEVRRLCHEMGRGGGYILAPAKALQPGTPIDNAVAIVEAFTSQG